MIKEIKDKIDVTLSGSKDLPKKVREDIFHDSMEMIITLFWLLFIGYALVQIFNGK